MNEDLDMLFNRETNDTCYINPSYSLPLNNLNIFEILVKEFDPARS